MNVCAFGCVCVCPFRTASSRSSLASMKKEQMPPAVASGGGKRELDSIRLVPIELKRQLSQAINAMSGKFGVVRVQPALRNPYFLQHTAKTFNVLRIAPKAE